jgi:hypothetical protein
MLALIEILSPSCFCTFSFSHERSLLVYSQRTLAPTDTVSLSWPVSTALWWPVVISQPVWPRQSKRGDMRSDRVLVCSGMRGFVRHSFTARVM